LTLPAEPDRLLSAIGVSVLAIDLALFVSAINRRFDSMSERNEHNARATERAPSDAARNRATCAKQLALLSRIESGTVRVGIIGLGYVGLPLARAFAEHGIAVLGFDLDAVKVAKLERGQSYIDVTDKSPE